MTERPTPWGLIVTALDITIVDANGSIVLVMPRHRDVADRIVAAVNAIPACEDALRRVDEEGIDDLTLNLIIKARTMLEACHANDTNRIG